VAFGEHVQSDRDHEDRNHEDGVTWRKSSWSSMNGNCVEVAELRDEMIGVRDTKDGGAGPVLLFEQTAWRSFIDGLKGVDSLL
jgi:Domain of unknown function (DUF397)